MFSKMKCLILFLTITIVAGASLGPEPQCSRYHYEEQLLERTIRTEIKVEEMDKRGQETDQKVKEVLTDLENERRNMKKEFEEYKADLNKLKDASQTETIAFKARGPIDLSLETGQVIVFTQTMFNYGEAYDNMTGVFTAPVGGTYMFTIHLCMVNKKNIYYGIVVNNLIQTSGVFYDTNTHQCGSADAIIVLKGREKVVVKCLLSSNGVGLIEYSSDTNNYWSTFSGVLIHK